MKDEAIFVGFIGAGKVGFSLGKFFVEGGIHVTGYYSRRQESAKQAAQFTGTEFYSSIEQLVRDSNVIFLTVPDGEIKGVFEQLKSYDLNQKQICHCSGAMSSKEAFSGISETGARGYSIHPLFPVSDKQKSYRELSGAFFCLEGDPSGVADWEKRLKKRVRGVRIIDSSCKVKYHAACAIASNLYCALVKLSLELMQDCGFLEEEAIAALTPLMESNLEHILQVGPTLALTGPVERADAVTVEKHIIELENATDRDLYVSTTKKLLEIAQKKNPDRSYEAFNKLAKEN